MLQLLGSLIPDANFHRALVVLLIVSMGYTGYANLNQQWSIKGEYQNYPQEDLLDWINDNTPKGMCLTVCQYSSGWLKHGFKLPNKWIMLVVIAISVATTLFLLPSM